ncbi:MAG: hypothetical protein CVV56_07025, partial [Tenericutes bacterium HGW-Tenericutes-1]
YLLLLLGIVYHPFSLYPYDTISYPLIKNHTNSHSKLDKISILFNKFKLKVNPTNNIKNETLK